MRTRRRVLVLVAFAITLLGPTMSPAHAAGCVPRCAFGGTVVGSIIVPGDKFNFKGTFQANSTNPGAHFNIENGTLKINGKNASNFKQAIVVEQYADRVGFSIANRSGGERVRGDFRLSSSGSYTSDNVAVGNYNGGGEGGDVILAP